MNRLTPALVTYVLPAAAALALAYGYAQSADVKNIVCEHQFALCTSARGVPVPGDATRAICFCDVEEGKSMGTEPCDKLKPTTDDNGIRTVYSTFALKQAVAGKKGLKCPDGTPWTWCLNKRCTVEPSDPKKAICTCDVLRKGEWMTFGGDCKKETCKTGYWSGAAVADLDSGTATMMKALGLEKSPVKWCEDPKK